jgi:hypothetical protein
LIISENPMILEIPVVIFVNCARKLATEISLKFMLGKLSDLNGAVFNQSIEIIG